jgi:hypothetical protein
MHWIGAVRLGLLNFLHDEFLILLQALCDDFLLADLGQKVGPSGQKWFHYYLNVPDLVLEWIACGPIVSLCNSVTHFLLDVSLLVVFFHFCCHPLEVYDTILAWVAMVRCVNTHV